MDDERDVQPLARIVGVLVAPASEMNFRDKILRVNDIAPGPAMAGAFLTGHIRP